MRLPAPPALPRDAFRGVRAALKRSGATCLERALVLQRWHSAQGAPRDVVIGVGHRDGDVVAHAWLDGDTEPGLDEYRELTRILPPA